MTHSTRARRALAIAAIGTVASAPGALAASPKTQTLQYRIRFNDTALDLGAPGPTLGDLQLLNDQLVNRDGNVVGHDSGVCTITSLDPPETNCNITFALPGGQITSQFLNSPAPRKAAAITGGTSRYRRARGDILIKENPDQTGTIVFRLARS